MLFSIGPCFSNLCLRIGTLKIYHSNDSCLKMGSSELLRVIILLILGQTAWDKSPNHVRVSDSQGGESAVGNGSFSSDASPERFVGFSKSQTRKRSVRARPAAAGRHTKAPAQETPPTTFCCALKSGGPRSFSHL